MADTNLGTFSPEDVIITITHPQFTHIISGYADGTFVSIERAMEASTLYQGADNSGGRVLHSNKSGTITLTLHQFSASNDVLSQLHLNDMAARDNTWLFNITVQDGTGRSKFYARQCFINNLPVAGFGNDVETRDWILQAVELNQYIGGNGQFTPDTADALTDLGGTFDPKWAPQQ